MTTNTAVLPQTPVTASAVVTASKTTYNDNVNAVRLIPAATVPNGALIKKLSAIPRASVTASQLQIYRSPDQGTTLYLVDSALLPAYTMSSTTAVPKTDFGYADSNILKLKAGEELWCASAVALSAGIVFNIDYEAY